MSELKACPFCGSCEVSTGKGKYGTGATFIFVECENCGASSSGDPDKATTIQAWNTRTPDPTLEKALDWAKRDIFDVYKTCIALIKDAQYDIRNPPPEAIFHSKIVGALDMAALLLGNHLTHEQKTEARNDIKAAREQ